MKTSQELNSLALETRRLLNCDLFSSIDIFGIVNGWKEKKITIVRYPLSNQISGMCARIDNEFVICINSTTSYGRQRFTLAHELYHILYERIEGRVVCDMEMTDNKSDSEKEADIFASYLLLPYDALYQYSRKINEWMLEKIIDIEQFYMISHMATLFRLKKDGFIKPSMISSFNNIKVSLEAAKLGYSKELYMPQSEDKSYFTTGEYIRKVEELSKKELISLGKKEQYLLDAFRADIVYNSNEGDYNIDD